MSYLLGVYIGPEVFNEYAAEASIKSIADALPDYTLVVDHAHGKDGFPRSAVADLDFNREEDRQQFSTLPRNRHGHYPAAFEPRNMLHEVADEVRCGEDAFLENEVYQRWHQALKFKSYSIKRAQELGLSYIVLMRWPSIWQAGTIQTMIEILERNKDLSWVWPPVLIASKDGKPTGRYEVKPAIAESLDPKAKPTEDGLCIRIEGLDPDEIRETSNSTGEAKALMAALLDLGTGRGVATRNGELIGLIKPEVVAEKKDVADMSATAADRFIDRLRRENSRKETDNES